MKNKFKIITPSYNNSQWVEYNLASVLNQTYTNWEVIYINDNSTDNTLQKVRDIVGNHPKYTIISNDENKGATYNYFEHLDLIDDDDIVIHLDGDDWLIDETVLEKLSELYTKTDCWMTYGGFVVWQGKDSYTHPFPQNTPYDDFVHDYKLYRRDMWRASHLRTYRGRLLKLLSLNDIKDLKTDKYYWHAADLAFQYPYMEICGKDKIQVVDFHTCVYNQHPSVVSRTRQRESENNRPTEVEIRNRKKYGQGLPPKKLPLVNVIGDYRERNSIPKKFGYVYNQLEGEFDITLIQDTECIRYLNGEFGKLPGVVIADLHEPPHLFNHGQTYDIVLQYYDKFDYIFTYSKKLLELPNAIFRNCGYECVLNKNVHTKEYPLLADSSLFGIYDKSKSVSIITSNKTYTPMHVFRTRCVDHIRNNKLSVDIFGVGFNEVRGKIEGLKDYKFSVTIENGEMENYFTEKILDTFLTGTIPIYYGCPNIDEYFNPKGIIKFNSIEQLTDIINNLDSYKVDSATIRENYEKAYSLCYDNDRLFSKFIEPILNKKKQV
jgi:glycosyltransferase involved in cell wall biosynthesis